MKNLEKTTTIVDIARAVGVTHQVVSAVLSGKKSTVKYSEKTRLRVLETAKRLNYEPNILARSFRGQRSFLIGVLFSSVNHHIVSEFFHGLQAVVSSNDFSQILFIHDDCEQELEFLDLCMDRKIEGLIFNSAIGKEGQSNSRRFKEVASNIPCVQVFGGEVKNVPSISLDYYSAAQKGTQYLIEKGHKSILLYTHDRCYQYVNAPGLYLTAWRYRQGYIQAMEEAGLEPIIVNHSLGEDLSLSGSSFAGAYDKASDVFDNPSKPTAVLCSDHEEIDALRIYLADSQITVHPDFHFVGPGSPSYFSTGGCKTSILVQPIRTVGQMAGEVLFDILKGNKREDCSLGFNLAE
jgi:DNA-binding LacI/PurR family transcriptional regulator